jgi:L-ribulose-5-phosphate 3-epimerase
MKPTTRRDFLRASTASVALATIAPALFAADAQTAATPSRKRRFKKGIMWATIPGNGSVLEKMKAVKAAGFDAVEMNSHMDQAEVLKARDETALEIVSVCDDVHWKKRLSDPDPKVRAEGLEALKQTLRDAKAYGTDSILLVPGVAKNGVTFDECWKRSIEQIRLAIPLAEELRVKISVENVWNDLITTEQQAVRYLDEINSPWVGWHFDVGNMICFGDPIDWIVALGKRINRVHVKEYSRDLAMRAGNRSAGFKVPLLQGANNWPGIMKALDQVGYTGPLITEQNASLDELSQALDKIMGG